MNILLGIATVLLVFLCVFLCFIILLQRPRQDSGMGAALGGGGIAESAFGAESGNILTKATVWFSVIFFVVGFALYLGFLYRDRRAQEDLRRLPTFDAPAAAATPGTDATLGAPPVTELPVVTDPAALTPTDGAVPAPVPTPAPDASAAPAEPAPTEPAPAAATPTP